MPEDVTSAAAKGGIILAAVAAVGLFFRGLFGYGRARLAAQGKRQELEDAGQARLMVDLQRHMQRLDGENEMLRARVEQLELENNALRRQLVKLEARCVTLEAKLERVQNGQA